jgi:hypothetical protein
VTTEGDGVHESFARKVGCATKMYLAEVLTCLLLVPFLTFRAKLIELDTSNTFLANGR